MTTFYSSFKWREGVDDSKTTLQSLYHKIFSLLQNHSPSSHQDDVDSTSIDDFLSHLTNICEGKPLVDYYNDLEIIFRAYMQDVISRTVSMQSIEADEILFKELKFSFAIASKQLSLGKIPFLQLEDIITALTISRAEKFWDKLEELTDDITRTDLFTKGNLVVLRICNFLLKKLSKTCNTEFCGRILMFLAAVYPITEKSALNTAGFINTSNVTTFDSLDEFNARETIRSKDQLANIEIAHSENNNKEKLTIDDISSIQKSIDEEEKDLYSNPKLNYKIYCMFWELQTFFSSDNKLLDSVKKWDQLKASLSQVFELFQSFKTKSASISSATSYKGCKFLTSSSLLGLQLRDPLLQQQIACQILFYLHHFKHRLPAFAIEEPKVFSKAKADVDLTPNLTKFKKDVEEIEQKAFKLLEKLGGLKMKQAVESLLYNERRYISWKKESCPPFESLAPNKELASSILPMTLNDIPKMYATICGNDSNTLLPRLFPNPKDKIKRYLMITEETLSRRNEYNFDTTMSNVKEYAALLVEGMPQFASVASFYADCEEDDMFHPKNDSLFCWRLRRLLAMEKLSVFDSMSDGNLTKGLTKLGYNVKIASKNSSNVVVSESTVCTTEDVDELDVSFNTSIKSESHQANHEQIEKTIDVIEQKEDEEAEDSNSPKRRKIDNEC